MSAGIALTDEDRWPWLTRVGQSLLGTTGHITSCSALKRSYREHIVASAGRPVAFVFLEGTPDLLAQRLAARTGHFMPSSLLASQLATLERPAAGERAAAFDIAQPVEAIAAAACTWLLQSEGLSMAEQIAPIGAGIMGQAIGARLLACGHDVQAFDIDAAKVALLVEKGARAAGSPADATQHAGFVILSLNHADIVKAAVFGADGVAAKATPHKLLIDMSSIDPGATAEMGTQLKTQHWYGRWIVLSRAVCRVRSPASLPSWRGSADDFERARAVMKDLAANYTLMGPSGAGQTTKLVNQLFCALAFQAVAEAVKLAEAGGVDPKHIPAALAGGRADGRIMQEFMAKFAARDFTPTGSLGNMLKDLDFIQAFALKTRTPLPLTSAVRTFIACSLPWGLARKTTPKPCGCSTESEFDVDLPVHAGLRCYR